MITAIQTAIGLLPFIQKMPFFGKWSLAKQFTVVINAGSFDSEPNGPADARWTKDGVLYLIGSLRFRNHSPNVPWVIRRVLVEVHQHRKIRLLRRRRLLSAEIAQSEPGPAWEVSIASDGSRLTIAPLDQSEEFHLNVIKSMEKNLSGLANKYKVVDIELRIEMIGPVRRITKLVA